MNHVTLDKQRPLNFTFGVLSQFEEMTGLNMMELDLGKIRLTEMIQLTFLGLKKADPEFNMSFDEVADLFKLEMVEPMMAAVGECLGGGEEKKE